MVGMNTADLIPDSMFVLHLHPVYVWEGPGGGGGWVVEDFVHAL